MLLGVPMIHSAKKYHRGVDSRRWIVAFDLGYGTTFNSSPETREAIQAWQRTNASGKNGCSKHSNFAYFDNEGDALLCYMAFQ